MCAEDQSDDWSPVGSQNLLSIVQVQPGASITTVTTWPAEYEKVPTTLEHHYSDRLACWVWEGSHSHCAHAQSPSCSSCLPWLVRGVEKACAKINDAFVPITWD